MWRFATCRQGCPTVFWIRESLRAFSDVQLTAFDGTSPRPLGMDPALNVTARKGARQEANRFDAAASEPDKKVIVAKTGMDNSSRWASRARRTTNTTVIIALVVVAGVTYSDKAPGEVAVSATVAAGDSPAVSEREFYGSLAPYGEWFWEGGYGWVWTPHGVSVGWRPYTNGYWVYTDDGWTWVSYFDWGWAPFHYGRWHYAADRGWVWVPGHEWAPAWVSWRAGGGYVGWAPLPPRAAFRASIGLTWSGDADVTEPHAWSFVPERHVLDRHIHGFVQMEPRNVTLMSRTRPTRVGVAVAGGRIVNRGLNVAAVSVSVGHSIRPVHLRSVDDRHANARLRGNELSVYQPRIRASADHMSKEPAPPMSGTRPGPQEIDRTHRDMVGQVDEHARKENADLERAHRQELKRVSDSNREQTLREQRRELKEHQDESTRHRSEADGWRVRQHSGKSGHTTAAVKDRAHFKGRRR